jgi:serine protease DegS
MVPIMSVLVRQWLLPGLVGLLVGGGMVVVWSLLAEPEPAATRSEGQASGYAAAVKRAAPSVVNIYSTVREVPPSCQRDPRLKPWCDRLMGTDRTSLGSGVIVHPDGFIVTNAHVIEGASDVLVMLADGRTAAATVIGSDRLTDLAVVRIALNGLTAITLGNPAQVAVGDVALAIGNPFGIGQTVSAGIISATGRASVSASPYDDFLQTDAAINPGNSGGALIDASGRLVGINTLILSPSGESMGVGFALPADLAYGVLTLGIMISGTEAAGPADRAGLRARDRITEINGEPVRDPNAFSRLVGMTRPGETIRLGVMRIRDDGSKEALSFQVVAGRRPDG